MPKVFPSSKTNLYVSGLAHDVTDADLQALFGPFGPISSAKVMLNIHSGISRGIAFVKFEQEDSAAGAVGLDGTVHHGSVITVKFADEKAEYNPGQPTNKIFVRNIPLAATADEVKRYFGKFGSVHYLSIQPDTAVHKCGGRGVVQSNMCYVSFSTVAEAKAAAEESHGKYPFKDSVVPLLAKVAESTARRNERLVGSRQHHPVNRQSAATASRNASITEAEGPSTTADQLPNIPPHSEGQDSHSAAISVDDAADQQRSSNSSLAGQSKLYVSGNGSMSGSIHSLPQSPPPHFAVLPPTAGAPQQFILATPEQPGGAQVPVAPCQFVYMPVAQPVQQMPCYVTPVMAPFAPYCMPIANGPVPYTTQLLPMPFAAGEAPVPLMMMVGGPAPLQHSRASFF